MSRIRSNDTAPEVFVRRAAHALGYRFRLHRKDLPGRPDMVFPRLRCVVFVHGCFWHHHPGCREGRVPSSNTGYWGPKLSRNVERDGQALAALAERGWRTLVLWECECRAQEAVRERLADFLGGPPIG